jgi:hypothetical protein
MVRRPLATMTRFYFGSFHRFENTVCHASSLSPCMGHMFRRIDVRRPGCAVCAFRYRKGCPSCGLRPGMGGVRQMGSIFSCLTVGCQSTDRSSLSRYGLTRFGFGSGVERKGGWGGKEKFRRHTSKCGTSTYNNGGLAFSDRTLDSQFFQLFFFWLSPCRRVVVTGCPDGAAAR